MAFFIAFFGIIYIIVRLSCEGSDKRTRDRKNNKARETTANLNAGSDIEYSIREKIKDSEKRWELLEEISPELEYVFGENWREKFKYTVKTSGFPYEPGRVACNIYLAKHGKTCSLENGGFSVYGTNEQTLVIIKMCKMMEKNIQQYYPNQSGLRLIFVPYFVDPQNGKYSDSLSGGSISWDYSLTGIGGKCHPPTLTMNEAENKCYMQIENQKKAGL